MNINFKTYMVIKKYKKNKKFFKYNELINKNI